MARAYQKAGYAGIVVTDHFFYGNTAADRSLPWKDWVEQFCKGYEHAKEHGLPITAGSDQHTTRMIGGGMLFDRKLSDEKDFCRAVLAGEAKAYWNGSEFYG